MDGIVEVTEIAFLSGGDTPILSRVRQSRKRARLFWCFLTQWLAGEDATGLKVQESQCVCGETHQYFPAAWLVPVAGNQWVPLERNRADRATAHSLAKLVRDSEWPVELLRTSQEVIDLLKALRVSVSELSMELVARKPDERESLDKTLAQLLTSVGSDWDHLRALAEDIDEDSGLFSHLEERRQHRRRVRNNQRLGKHVEQLVKECLEVEGFEVQSTGIGSDISLEARPTAAEDQIQLELKRRGRTWLVEIKSSRADSVKMTSCQARTAVKNEHGYLLCVVPIISGPEEPDEEAVRRGMHFVDDIGVRLAGICDDLDNFEKIRENVTVKDSAGLRLELDSGSPRIRISSTVWEAGFGLNDLSSRLAASGGSGDNGAS